MPCLLAVVVAGTCQSAVASVVIFGIAVVAGIVGIAAVGIVGIAVVAEIVGIAVLVDRG